MPNDVEDALYKLAAASKQAGGITFTDADKDETEEDKPIPIHNAPIMEDIDNMIDDNEIHEQQEDDTITGVHDKQEDGTITGVHENKQNNDNTSEHDPENTQDNVQTTPEEEKNESDEYLTIEDINVTS